MTAYIIRGINDLLLNLMKQLKINITKTDETECDFDKGIEIITNTLNDRNFQTMFNCSSIVHVYKLCMSSFILISIIANL
jgi:hypothetical protein